MAGAFDDLIPEDKRSAGGGAFDDLVPAPKTGFVEGAKRLGRELVEGGRQLVQAGRTGNLVAAENERKQLEYEERRAREIGDASGAALLRERIAGLNAQSGQRAASIAQSEAGSDFKPRPVIEAISRAKTAGEAWDAFKQDPTGAILGVTATSAAQMVPALLAGIATGGIAGVATMGASSAASEYGSSLLDFARENQVDVKDAAKVQAFFKDPANLRAGMEYAGVRAGIIGAADAATGGIATRTLAPKMVTGPLARQAVNVPTQMAVQAAGGAGGEAGAQIATKGEITEPGAVLLEAVGELGGAPVEVASLSNEIRKGLSPQRKSLEDEIKDVLDAPDIDSAIAAANDLSRANTALDAATADYLGGESSVAPAGQSALPGSALPTGPAPGSARPTAADIDRQAELTQQSLTAGTEFERQSAAAQAAVARGEPQPGPAAQFVDLTPMNPLQARQRLIVLRDQLAQEGGNALELQIASHPSQKGALAIGRQPLPALEIEGAGQPAPISQPEAQQRIEGAAMVGAQNQRRAAPEERGRQEIVTRALKAVEERGGVAAPAEARIFQEAGVGKPYDRIDESLAPPLNEEEKLTQATGIAVGRAPRETVTQTTQQPATEQERLAAQARANEQGFANLAAGAPFRQAARTVGEKAAADAAARPPEAPSVGSVLEALRVPPMRRGADLKARLNAARQRYSAEEMAALELQANAPATMTQEQRLTVKRLSEPRASNRRLEEAGLREVSVNELPSRTRASKQGKVTLQGITRETHGLIQRLGRLYGKKVVVYEGEGDSRDGFFDPKDPDTVYINRNASKPHLIVFGHELLHSLKQSSPEVYRALAQAIRGQLKVDAAERFAEDYGPDADAEELVADLIGNRMAEESFWAEVFSGMDAPAARKLGMAVVSAVEKAKKVVARMAGFKTDELVKDLDAVKAAAVKAMREYAVLRKDAARAMPAPESVVETQQAPIVASAQQSSARPASREGEQPRAADGTFKAWSDEDELAAAAEQQTRFSPTRNNASGESAASLEAQGRIRQEQALDRQRVLVERDGSVRPLVGVNAVDQRARGAQVILQKNIGKDTWTVIEEGPEVTAPIRARAIYNAGRQRASARRQTETPEFKAWFGESKVVDAEGKPLVVYHGTSKDADFNKFKIAGRGAWFTEDANSASDYAEDNDSRGPRYNPATRRYEPRNTASRVLPVYLSIKNPYVVTERMLREDPQENYARQQRQQVAQAKMRGHDGMSYPGGVWIAFRPEQIKSAIGNDGSFDANDADIRSSTRRPEYGEKREGAISVTGVHYSQQQRTALDSAFAGTGLKGADLARVERDKGEKQRIYFYVDKGQGVMPESGVGGYAHEVQLNNLYDADADPLFLAEDNPGATAFERAVTKAGFDGYYRDSFRTDVGAAVLLGKHRVDVAPAGQGPKKASGQKPARAAAPERTGWRKTLADLKASKRLPGGALDGSRWPGVIKQLEPTVYEGMLPSGVFEAVFDRKGVYKSELAKEYQQRATPRRDGPDAKLNKKQRALYVGRYLDDFALSGETLANNGEVGEMLQRNAREALGDPLLENTPANREFLSGVLAAEALRALGAAGNAGQWYKQNLQTALKTAEKLHPELADDENARFVFTFALAITSNGQTIAENTRLAFEAYKRWAETGVLPARIDGGGERAGGMVRAFQDFNGMVRNSDLAAVRAALLKKWNAKELKTSSGKDIQALNDEEVYGGVLFGPKIGGAFLQNLNGNFDALTIDRWMMRTWGRLTGRLVSASSKTGLRDAPGSAGERKYIRETMEQALEEVRVAGQQIDMADLQATLWYPEKELYNTLGRENERSKPTDYAKEFEAYVKDRSAGRASRRASDGAGRRARGATPARVSPQVGLFDALPADPGAVRYSSAVRGSARRLEDPYRSNRGSDLVGAQGRVDVPGVGPVEFHGFKPAQDAAAKYMAALGERYTPPTTYAKVDKARAERIAQAYDEMAHAPNDPAVKAAYAALASETIGQYQAVLDTGLKVEFIPPGSPDPYAASPRLAILDVVENNHLWVFSTRDGFGSSDFDPASNPLLAETEFDISGQPALLNDLFRVVHDYFGHVKDGVGFRADGEENAWRAHAAMFTPLARRALTSETRGQNSWVNFGPYGESNRKASGGETRYADQKTGLLPQWAVDEGRTDDAVTPATDDLVELRKQASVLRSLRKCLA